MSFPCSTSTASFGGKAGNYLLTLLRKLRMPIVTTLHTVLGKPDSMQRRAMNEITRLSKRLVVMSAHGAVLLHNVHGVPEHKIDIIPHGIPSVPYGSSTKKELGFKGKSVIFTFGLLSPDKGIEHVIDALPAILARYPEHGLRRPRRYPSTCQRALRGKLPRKPRASGTRTRGGIERDLSQPFREPR